MIALSNTQASMVVGLMADALAGIDAEIQTNSDTIKRSGLLQGEGAHDPGVEEASDRIADLMEEYEQAHRLREIIISQVGNTSPPHWECPDEGCCWITPNSQSLCEQCGQERPEEITV